jgi:NAD(P)-dependent dehydrogenase (short-subunit alcohol dehydrogenase family)
MATSKQLLGKKALITGASSGLGLAMAKALAQAGATVVITARDAAKLADAQAQLGAEQLDVQTLVLDVRDEASIADAVQWVRTHWGSLDLLVNNAGIGMRTVNPDFLTRPQPFYEVSAAGFRDLIDTNLTGYFLVAKAFVPLFLAQGRGKIVNISMNHETMRRQGLRALRPFARRGRVAVAYHGRRPARGAYRRKYAATRRRHRYRHDTGRSQGRACGQISVTEPQCTGRAHSIFGL